MGGQTGTEHGRITQVQNRMYLFHMSTLTVSESYDVQQITNHTIPRLSYIIRVAVDELPSNVRCRVQLCSSYFKCSSPAMDSC